MARLIVHATDFSAASRPAFQKALEIARKTRRGLAIVHVIAPPVLMMGDSYVSPKLYEDVDRAQRAAAQKRLDRLVRAARARGIRATGQVLEGVFHEEIGRAARAKHADMIVMGTHGRTGFKRVLLGSVAARVLGTAPCPVLSVRAAA